MDEPDVIVYERTGRWATCLKLALARQRNARAGDFAAARLCEARSLAEVTDLLHASATGLVVLELTSGSAPRILEFVARLDDQHPDVKNVVVSRSRDRDWEDAARWAGALLHATSLAELAPVAGLVEQAVARRLERCQGSAAQGIWSTLPWPPRGAATAAVGPAE